MKRQSQLGFNLIEIVVVVGLLAFLLALGIPSMSDMIANNRVRTTAEGLLNGLQLARAEAVRQNSMVEMFVHDGGVFWDVVTLDNAGDRYRLGTRGQERSAGVTPAVALPGGTAVTFYSNSAKTATVTLANTTRFAFNGWGELVSSPVVSPFGIRFVSNVAGARAMCVAIVANTPRLCDPQRTIALDASYATDPQACYFQNAPIPGCFP